MDSNVLPFDRVKVEETEGQPHFFSPAEFLNIPLSMRLRWILERKVEFFLSGVIVPQRDALKALRQRAAAIAA